MATAKTVCGDPLLKGEVKASERIEGAALAQDKKRLHSLAKTYPDATAIALGEMRKKMIKDIESSFPGAIQKINSAMNPAIGDGIAIPKVNRIPPQVTLDRNAITLLEHEVQSLPHFSCKVPSGRHHHR